MLGVPIAATEQYPEKLSSTVPELKQRLGQVPSKLAFSACECGEIFERWRDDGRFRVLVCGIETHVCIMQTALDLAATVSNRMWPWMRSARGMRSITKRRCGGWNRPASC